MVAYGEGGEDVQNLSAEDGTENTASCMKRQSDESWSKAENQQEGHRGSGSQLDWRGRSHVARMGQRRCVQATSMWDVRIGKRGRPKTRWQTRTREYQEDSDHGQPKTGANVVDTNNIRKTSVTNSAHIRESGHTSVYSDASANLADRSMYYEFPVSTQRR